MDIADETIEIKEIAPYLIRKLVPTLLLQCNDLENNDNALQLYFKEILFGPSHLVYQGILVIQLIYHFQALWAAFKKNVTDIATSKPTIPEPPDYKVCKE